MRRDNKGDESSRYLAKPVPGFHKGKMAYEREITRNNRRRFGRYPFQRPVSLCLHDMDGRELWRLGWIQNADAGGMKIRLNGQAPLRRHQEVLIVVQSENRAATKQSEQEIRGRVTWIDDSCRSFGLQFI